MNEDQRVWTAFILLGVIWGTSFLFIKIGLRTLDPLLLVTLRLIIGWLGLMAIMRWRNLRLPTDWSSWRHLFFLGVFNTAIPFTLITWAESGENGIDSATAVVLNSTVPLFSLIIAGVIVRSEAVTLGKVGGLVVGFVGVLLLLSQELGQSGDSIWPQLAVVSASLCYAISSIYARKNVHKMNPVTVSAGQLLTAEIMMLGATLLIVDFDKQSLSAPTVISLLWLGLLGSCFAYIMFFNVLRNWGATRTTMVTYMLPVVGVAAGVLFLDESLSWRLVIGGLLIISGIVLVNWRPYPKPAVKPDGQGAS